jgi:hypothetical protein
MSAPAAPRPRPSRRLAVCLTLVCLCLGSGSVAADAGIIDRVGSVFEGIARSLNLVGQKSEDILAPRLDVPPTAVQGSFAGLIQETREVRESYPVLRNASVSIRNHFGQTHVDTWDSQVVRVVAQITVGAQTAQTASDVAARTEVRVDHSEDHVAIETVFPDTHALGNVPISVTYFVTVPREASLATENAFGDLAVHGVGGALTVDSRFGAVTLDDLAGPVKVRAKGQFEVAVTGLKQGGTFELSDTTALFTNVDGPLQIRSHLGTVELRSLGPQARVDAATDSGDIRLFLDEGAAPDLTATAVFGTIESDLQLERTSLGEAVYARNPHSEAMQQIALHTSFGTVSIRQQGVPLAEAPPLTQEGELIKQGPQEEIVPIADAVPILVNAAVGDVTVEGIDENMVRVSATRLVRVLDSDNARDVLKNLTVSTRQENGAVHIDTAVTADMAALGCTTYRIDVLIRCPRTSHVAVTAQNGQVLVTGLGAGATVDQEQGALEVEHVKGPLDLQNARGDVRVSQCEGPVEAEGAYGTVSLSSIYGAINALCQEGRLIIDAPGGPVTALNRGGDVRVLALEGVGGTYDVQADSGDISIVLPSTADATLVVKAENGGVYSAIPLTGTTQRSLQQFMGQLNVGTHQISLTTRSGDININ